MGKLIVIGLVVVFITVLGFVIWDLNKPTSKTANNLPPDAAISACKNKKDGDSCEFLDKEKTVQGTCDTKPSVLACNPGQKEQVQEKTSSLILTSDIGADGATLPIEYTCDGSGSSPAFSWNNIPNGTKELSLVMSTIPVDGNIKYSWIINSIPANITKILKNSTNVGTITSPYKPPCSQGPGVNKYTFTLTAFSSSKEVLGTSALSFNYARNK